MKYIDLRSDTVTVPLMEMRELMITAAVGDDVYGDDPTVIKLENMAADMVGKEAALFVPSGTFGNQLAIVTHTKRGDEIIVGSDSHVLMHEVGAAAVISGVQTRSIDIIDKYMDPLKLKKMIRSKDIHYPDTGLICLENARSDGTVLSLQNMMEIKKVADEFNIPVHLDGARYFNAVKALDIGNKDMARYVDSINICLSKGLCAPIGSLLIGTKIFIEKARKYRKLMGGGLRQTGILAAPGIYALENLTERLAIDHENAKYMAGKLNDITGINVYKNRLDINMVFFTIPEDILKGEDLITGLLKKGIKINGSEDGEYRFVTHYYISKDDIDYVIKAVIELIQ